MIPKCYRCTDEIESPVEAHAAYVEADDIVEQDTVEVAEAVVHTDETKAAIAKVRDEHYPDLPTDDVERAVVSGTDLIAHMGTPESDQSNAPDTRRENARSKAPSIADFDRAEITDVSNAPAGTVKVERRVTTRDVQKRGLICPDCLKDGDAVIWGIGE